MLTVIDNNIYKMEYHDNSIMAAKKILQNKPEVIIVIYKDKQVIGVITKDNISEYIENKLTFEKVSCYTHSDEVFCNVRNYIFKEELSTDIYFPVINSDADILYILKYEKNQDPSLDWLCQSPQNGNWVSNFENYNIDDKNMDFELIDRGEVFIFETFEEYTYQIAKIILKRGKKSVIFLDSKAKIFFSENSNLKIVSCLREFYEKYSNLFNKSIFYINSKKSYIVDRKAFLKKEYSSLEIMTSIFWACDIKKFGELNAEKVFYLIRNPLYYGGLADLVKFTLFRIEMINRKKRGYIPVIDISLKNDINQFSQGNGDNIWEYYFEQISDISVAEVYKSKNVIISSHQLEIFNPYVQEVSMFVVWRNMFKKYLKFNDYSKNYIQNLYSSVVSYSGKKILGVIGRGTDYNASKSHWVPKPMNPVKLKNEVEKYFFEWKYDYIFLATEDAEIYAMFMESILKEKILYVDQERIDYSASENKNLYLSEIKIRKKVNGYLDGLQYLGILYILSKCDSIISSCTCGASNMTRGLKKGEFEHFIVYKE